MNSEEIIKNLLEMDEIRRPLMKQIIDSLNMPRSSYGLDVGCGIGLQTVLLAEKVGPNGKVTGLDINQELLDAADRLLIKTPEVGQTDFRQGSFTRLPFNDHEFDWIWSADCVGYPAGDMTLILPELLRVVKPGGSVFITAWTSQQILPGFPLLENRLNADYSAYNPYLKGEKPENHFLNMLHWFDLYDLENPCVRTFTKDLQAPLSPLGQQALAALYSMLWQRPTPETSSREWKDFNRLCRLESKDFLPARQDYYGFFSYTVFGATKK